MDMSVDTSINIVSIIELLFLLLGGVYALGIMSANFKATVEVVEKLTERLDELEGRVLQYLSDEDAPPTPQIRRRGRHRNVRQ
jgi:p-aminobenzoyl-glutamate transporter AbgT